MVFRRGLDLFYILYGKRLYSIQTADLSAESIALISSLLFAIGVAWIAPLFLSFKRSEEVIERLRRRNELILNSAGEGIFGLDLERKFTFVNPSASRMLGYEVDELIGKTSEMILDLTKISGRPYSGEECSIYAAYRDGLSSHTADGLLRKKDGASFFVEYISTPIVENGKFIGTVVTFNDLTTRKNLDKVMLRLNRAYKTLINCNEVLIRAKEEQILLDRICRTVVEIGRYRMCWVGYAETDSVKTVRPVSQAGYEEGYLDAINVTWADEERGRGPVGTAIHTGTTVVVKDIKTDKQFAIWREEAVRRGYVSIIALPLIEGSSVLGALAIYASEPDAFDQDEIDLLIQLSNDLVYGINSLRTHAAHKRVEEELRLKARLLDLASDSIFLHDFNGNFLYVNETACKSHGYTNDEFMSINLHNLDMPHYAELIDPRMKELLERGSTMFETAHFRKDRSIIPLEVHISTTESDRRKLILSIARDITERKKAEDALRASEKELHDNFFTQSTINIILSESLKNIPLEEILQKSLNMVLSIPWLAFEPIGSIHLVEDAAGMLVMKAQCNLPGSLMELCRHIPFGKCICGRAALTQQIEFADHLDDRHEICYEGMDSHGHYSVPILYGGNTLGVLNIYLSEGHVRDKTEEEFLTAVANTLAGIIVRKRVEEEKDKLHVQLLQSQKMEAVGQLAGGIAHDFNNILTAMMGYGQMLKMKMKEEDPLKRYADDIISLSHDAANLTQSLLAFSRKQIMEPNPVRLNEIVSKMEYLLAKILKEDIQLRTALSKEDLIVMADKGRMEQVLMNLATNARDAMPKGGLLSIKTEKVNIDTAFLGERGYGKQGQYALLSFTDTGTGMNRETKEKMFEPFFTTKEVGKGTGLGLSIVYGIVKQHDGYIDVYSEPGQGTSFKIYLPLVQATVEEVAPPDLRPGERGNETVLMAEDETKVRVFIKELLEEFGYKIIEAADGVEAVRKFVLYKDNIQLVILDLIMPNKNGKEAYEEMKKIKPDFKALFMSGYTGDILQEREILEEGLNFLSKPILPSSLLKKIREMLNNRA